MSRHAARIINSLVRLVYDISAAVTSSTSTNSNDGKRREETQVLLELIAECLRIINASTTFNTSRHKESIAMGLREEAVQLGVRGEAVSLGLRDEITRVIKEDARAMGEEKEEVGDKSSGERLAEEGIEIKSRSNGDDTWERGGNGIAGNEVVINKDNLVKSLITLADMKLSEAFTINLQFLIAEL